MQEANNINIHSSVPQSRSLSNTWSWCTLHLPNKIAYLGSFQNKETGYFRKCIPVIISWEIENCLELWNAGWAASVAPQ